MDVSGKDGNVEARKGGDEPINYQESNTPSDWQVNGNSLANGSIGMIPISDSTIGEQLSARSSTPMVDSFGLLNWDQNSNNVQNLGYCDVNVQNGSSTSGSLSHVRPDMSWMPNALFRGGMFLPAAPGMLPPSLPHLPVDSGFIERAARFSCFGGGNLGEMMNSFGAPDPLAPYSRGVGMMQGPHHEVFGGNEMKLHPGVQSQRHEMNVTEVSKEAMLSVPYENEKRSVQRGSDEAEFSGRGAREEQKSPAEGSPHKGFDSKKRKRGEKESDRVENNDTPQASVDIAKNTVDVKQKGDQNQASISKPGGKQGKQGSQGSDVPKEEYIHVRARRGQATNSHSLAERVRREKISERMKFLQDLVPGCSKVTGKAVMLDEIINYVQSLQRQVEFLSMKLATVNPRLDFNIESFLSKDPRAGLSPSLAFPPDVTAPFSPLHPSQPGLIPTGLLGNSSEPLRRPVNLQSIPIGGGYKEPTSQVPSVWEDELHNIVHMGLNTSAPLSNQDLSGSLPTGRMKAEP